MREVPKAGQAVAAGPGGAAVPQTVGVNNEAPGEKAAAAWPSDAAAGTGRCGPAQVDCGVRAAPGRDSEEDEERGAGRRGGGSAGCNVAPELHQLPSSKVNLDGVPTAAKYTNDRKGPALAGRTSSRMGDKPSCPINSRTTHNSASRSGPNRHHCCPGTARLNGTAASPNTKLTWAVTWEMSASADTRTATSFAEGNNPKTPGTFCTASQSLGPASRCPRSHNNENRERSTSAPVEAVQNGRTYSPPHPLPHNQRQACARCTPKSASTPPWVGWICLS